MNGRSVGWDIKKRHNGNKSGQLKEFNLEWKGKYIDVNSKYFPGDSRKSCSSGNNNMKQKTLP